MRWAATILLLLTATASAQTELTPNQVTRVRREFESHPGETPLRCEVTPLAPVLNFAFRFQAGYTFHVPQGQYPGPIQGWSELTAITPEDGSGSTTYLVARHQFSEVSRTDLYFDIQGLYLLGVGTYSVESAIRDDGNRICRRQWQIVVKPSRANGRAQSALPPFTVRQISATSWSDTRHTDAAEPLRLSVFLNAAAFSPRRTSLRDTDRVVLMETLTAMLEHLPTASLRLVVFSLEQQREVFRSDNFSLPSMSKVAEAIAALHLATVDVGLLQKPLGHVDFLAGLINRELQAPAPADRVVFLGPPSRYENHIPAAELQRPSAAYPRFFYLQYQGPRRPPPPSTSLLDAAMSQIGSPAGRAGGPSQSTGGGLSYPDPASASEAPQPPSRQPPPNNGNTGIGTNPAATPGVGGSGGGNPNPGGGSGSGGHGGRNGSGGRGLPPIPEPAEGDFDIIREAVSRLRGRTLVLHTPAELATAIRKIEQRH